MSIFKKGTYNNEVVDSFSIDNLKLESDTSVDKLLFNQDEYIEIMELGKEKGFELGKDEGYKDGYNIGYNEGREKFVQEQENFYSKIESDKKNLAVFLNDISIQYLNKFNEDALDLIIESLDKVFFGAVQNELIISTYINNVINRAIATTKDIRVYVNSNTKDLIDTKYLDIGVTVEIDDSLKNNDIVLATQHETVEYFLENEFNKIKKIFLN